MEARFHSEVPDVMKVLKFADSKPYFQDTSRVGLKSKVLFSTYPRRGDLYDISLGERRFEM